MNTPTNDMNISFFVSAYWYYFGLFYVGAFKVEMAEMLGLAVA